MIQERIACYASFALALSGCIVAPCPKDGQCGAVASSGGAPGAAGGGASGKPTNGGGAAGDTGGSEAGVVLHGTWENVTGNLAGLDSECGNMSYLSAKPDADVLIAGITLEGLWSSTNHGSSWERKGARDASAPITNSTSSIVYDPADPKRYWESGLYYGGGVYETKDDGNTFVALGDERHNDLVSIDFTDPERKTLLAGGHEHAKTLDLSVDGGLTWKPVGTNLPDNTNCTFPLVIDAHTYLVGCGGYGGGVSGVFRTTNSGAVWTQVSPLGGASTPLQASDGSLYWASPFSQGMAHSTDKGQTWTQATGPSVVISIHPVQLPDGRLATIGPQYGKQYVQVSEDQGAHFAAVTTALPYEPTGILYSAFEKTFYIWHLTCGSGSVPVPADAIYRYDFGDAAP